MENLATIGYDPVSLVIDIDRQLLTPSRRTRS